MLLHWFAVLLAVAPVPVSPLISDVLPCGETGIAATLAAAGTEMQRLDLDTDVDGKGIMDGRPENPCGRGTTSSCRTAAATAGLA